MDPDRDVKPAGPGASGDKRGVLVRWMEGITSGEIRGGPG